MNMKKQKSGKIKPILIKQMLDLIGALVSKEKSGMVNRTNGLKSNVRQSDNVDKIKMTMQQQRKQCEADKISNKKSFSHKNQEKNVGKPTFLQEQVLKKERTVNKKQTDLNSCCCATKQTEKQSDFFIAKDIPDFNSMNIEQLKTYLQERGVPASSYNKVQLIILAKAVFEMDLPVDLNFESDDLTPHLERRTTLPNGTKVLDPFKMTELTNDLSFLPPFGLLDIFNHLIMSRVDCDKEGLSSWRSFEEYSLFLDGYVRSIKQKTIDDAVETFHVIVAAQKDKTPEGNRCYKLWFILDKRGSVYSAFCQCKDGADQGCRHLGAAMFSLEDFLSGNRLAVTSYLHIGIPNLNLPKTQFLFFILKFHTQLVLEKEKSHHMMNDGLILLTQGLQKIGKIPHCWIKWILQQN